MNRWKLWTYEPSFNEVVCHADANGYVTWNSIDSSTGKVLKSTRYDVDDVPGLNLSLGSRK